MELYEFTEAIRVDGVPFKAGDIIKANDIPRGCLESLKQTKRVKCYVEEKKPVEPKKVDPPKPEETKKPVEPKK